jgi:DNA-binding transcriptional regulator YiaG
MNRPNSVVVMPWRIRICLIVSPKVNRQTSPNVLRLTHRLFVWHNQFVLAAKNNNTDVSWEQFPRTASDSVPVPRVITAIRQRLGITQTRLAEKLGVLPSTISRYEAGILTPSRPVLRLLLQIARGPERGPILKALSLRGAPQSEANTALVSDAQQPAEQPHA